MKLYVQVNKQNLRLFSFIFIRYFFFAGIGIMKSGQFVCLGNLQRLKTRFSLGYNARIKVSPTNLTRFKSELDSILPGIEIDGNHESIFHLSF